MLAYITAEGVSAGPSSVSFFFSCCQAQKKILFKNRGECPVTLGGLGSEGKLQTDNTYGPF